MLQPGRRLHGQVGYELQGLVASARPGEVPRQAGKVLHDPRSPVHSSESGPGSSAKTVRIQSLFLRAPMVSGHRSTVGMVGLPDQVTGASRGVLTPSCQRSS